MKNILQILILISMVFLLSACKDKEVPAKENSVTQQIIKEEERELFDLEGLSNESVGWGLKKNPGAPPDVPSEVKLMLEKYNGIYIGDTSKKTIYLTFDEGYENGFTAGILDTLKRNDVSAAFFVTGDYAEREPELLKRMAKEGHIIGNHTMNHPSLPLVSIGEIENEMKVLDELVEKICGVKMKYVRPPKGEYSEKVLAHLSNMGYKTVFWSFAYMDWDVTLTRGGEYAFGQIYPYLDEGEILLLHAVSADNADCLDRFIKIAKAEGYTFGTLDEL